MNRPERGWPSVAVPPTAGPADPVTGSPTFTGEPPAQGENFAADRQKPR